jgi:hypothetical protein
MITISRLIALKQDLATLARAEKGIAPDDSDDNAWAVVERLGHYRDILEDYLRIQQGSA